MDVTLVGLIGVLLGAIITAFLQYYFGRQKDIKEKEFAYKEARYKALTILMYARTFPENINRFVTKIRPELRNAVDIDQELKAELVNGLIYASDDMLSSFKSFIQEPTQANLVTTVLAIRKDLWGRKTKIKGESIYLNSEKAIGND